MPGWPPFGRSPDQPGDDPMNTEPPLHPSEDTPVEPRAIDPNRTRLPAGSTTSLTPDEMFRLTINCIIIEQRRGYR